MNERPEFELRQQLMAIGIISDKEQDTILDIARRCTRFGVVTGTGWAVLGAPALAPGMLAGFFSGFLSGTAACTALNLAAREQLKEIARTGL